MENLDLDINNYTLDDLLNLFKLDYNFTSEHLKKAKMVSFMTHPDKSNLDMKYFIFFSQTYDMLEKVFYFRNKRKSSVRKTYVMNESEKHILDSLKNKNMLGFNKWFNKLFEKVKVNDNQNDGYNNWYKSKSNIKNEECTNLSDFDNIFEKKREIARNSIIDNKELYNVNYGSRGFNLGRNIQDDYSSEVFSKLKYEDLKKAHTETVIPVTIMDMPIIDNTVNYSHKKKIEPMTALEIQKYNERNKYKNSKLDMERAYSLVKDDIEMEDSKKKWWAHLKKIKKHNI